MVNRAQLSCLSITLSISVACFFYILYRAPPTYPLAVLIHLRVFAVFGNLTNSLWLCMWKQNLAIVSCRCVWLRELVYVCVCWCVCGKVLLGKGNLCVYFRYLFFCTTSPSFRFPSSLFRSSLYIVHDVSHAKRVSHSHFRPVMLL